MESWESLTQEGAQLLFRGTVVLRCQFHRTVVYFEKENYLYLEGSCGGALIVGLSINVYPSLMEKYGQKRQSL
jgi:hypothetical protein